MRIFTKEELKDILEKHLLWLKGDVNGIKADLSGANLRGSNLRGSNLRDSDLRDSDLRDSDLRDSDLSDSDLRGSYLRGSDLRGSDLSGANLSGANLSDSDLRDSDLRDSDLSDELLISYTSITPAGTLIGWKKCKDNIIVKLEIPIDSKRSNSTSRKCRAEFVKVIEIFNGEIGISQYDGVTLYKKGGIVKCDIWEPNRWIECGGGIHFFLTRLEAENYY